MNVGCGPGSGSGASAAATSGTLSAAGLEAAPGAPPPPPLQEAARSNARPPRAAHARIEDIFPAVYADFAPAKPASPGRRARTGR